MGKLEDAKKVARANKDLSEDQLRIHIMESVPCSKSTANSAIRSIVSKKPTEKKKPSIKILKREGGGEGKPTILTGKREEKLETLREVPSSELGAKIIGEGELNAEDMASMFLAINELFPPKTRPSARSATMLGKLSYRPFNTWWANISASNPILAIAGVALAIVYIPAIIRSVIDWQKSRPKKKKEPEENKN